MALPCHGGASCGLTTLHDSDTLILQRLWDPLCDSTWSQKHPHIQTELISLTATEVEGGCSPLNWLQLLLPNIYRPKSAQKRELKPRPEVRKDLPNFSQWVHGTVRTGTQVSKYQSCIIFLLSLFEFFKEAHIGHTTTVPWSQSPRSKTLAQSKDHVHPYHNDSNGTKSLQHSAGLSVFSFCHWDVHSKAGRGLIAHLAQKFVWEVMGWEDLHRDVCWNPLFGCS